MPKVLTDSKTSNSAIYGFTALIGMGVGSILTASVAVAQALVDTSDAGNAVGAMVGGKSFPLPTIDKKSQRLT